jgi:hypothetical protein
MAYRTAPGLRAQAPSPIALPGDPVSAGPGALAQHDGATRQAPASRSDAGRDPGRAGPPASPARPDRPGESPPFDLRAWAERFVHETLARLPGVTEADLAALRVQAATLGDEPQGERADPSAVRLLRDRRALEQAAAELARAPAVAADVEATGDDPRGGEVVGLGLATASGRYYVPVGHRSPQTGRPCPDQVTPADAAQALGLAGLPLVAHNAKNMLHRLRDHAGVTPRFTWDTSIAARLLRGDLSAGLGEVVRRELGVNDWDLSREERAQIASLPVDRVAAACCGGCALTLRLMEKQHQCLS